MGDNIYLGDRDSVRTPMQWSPDRNAGFSRANPQKLFLPTIIDPEYHFESINVEAQQANSTSLLWWMKRIMALRKQHQVFGRGSIEFLHPDNPKVLAFIRRYEGEEILCVFNLSRFAQYVELDLHHYDNYVPLELFGNTEFPRIGELPYLLTLGAHGFYWFLLESPDRDHEPDAGWPVFEAPSGISGLLKGRAKRQLERSLAAYLVGRRWFRSKTRKVKHAHLLDTMGLGASGHRLAIVQVELVDGTTEDYVLVLGVVTEEAAAWVEHDRPHAVIGRLKLRGGEQGLVVDALASGHAGTALLSLFGRKKRLQGAHGHLEATTFRGFKERRGAEPEELPVTVAATEQTNTSVMYGDRLMLKVYRALEEGQNPEVEVGRHLTEGGFPHVPPVLGTLEYFFKERGSADGTASVGLVQGFVSNQGDAWSLTLDRLDGFFEEALARGEDEARPPQSERALVARARAGLPQTAHDMLGVSEPLVRLLGQRTAEMHLALQDDAGNAAFAPEELSQLHQRGMYQSARTRLKQTLTQLKSGYKSLPSTVQPAAKRVLDGQAELDRLLKRVVGRKIEAIRIRTHGDYHLGQVLYTGKDFVIIDFEGEPARPIGERRFKRSPLRDVAGMLRSFHYASTMALRDERRRPEDVALLEPWRRSWHDWTTAAYLAAWLEGVGDASIVPSADEDLETLLEFYLLDKCVYELGYELNNRPDWVSVPLSGLAHLARFDEGA
jgi:maltose alpha-D-glucosyltransferase/alpha-amylase